MLILNWSWLPHGIFNVFILSRLSKSCPHGNIQQLSNLRQHSKNGIQLAITAYSLLSHLLQKATCKNASCRPEEIHPNHLLQLKKTERTNVIVQNKATMLQNTVFYSIFKPNTKNVHSKHINVS